MNTSFEKKLTPSHFFDNSIHTKSIKKQLNNLNILPESTFDETTTVPVTKRIIIPKKIIKNIDTSVLVQPSKNDIVNEYSDLSFTLTKSIDKNEKKNNGIFFTPPKTIYHNLNLLTEYIKDIKFILEPSCGSCEYISALNKKFKNLNIIGIEKNETIYNSILELDEFKNSSNIIDITNDDFLKFNTKQLYDLIIGNPPYFVMKKNEVEKKYLDYFDGRPNIFILFIIKSLKLLNTNGILSFILPKNFLNCLYYDKTRTFISQNFKIIHISHCNDNYIETAQDTILFILQNKPKDKHLNEQFILQVNDNTIFGVPDDILKIKKLYLNSTTLKKLGFNANIGTVVWNQCKDILTDDTTKTLLIYSSDIYNNQLKIQKYSNKDKKNYINKKGFNEPILLVNRGYGVGNYKFEYLLIEGGFDYLIENHLISIKHSEKNSKEQLIDLYKKIIKSLENKKTKLFIELYFGNNAINTSELHQILPIYDFHSSSYDI